MPNVAWLAVWLIVISAMIALGIRDVRRDRRRSRAESARRAARHARFDLTDDAATSWPPAKTATSATGELDTGLSA